MNYIELLKKRRSSKMFGGVVTKKDIDTILDAGIQSPSSFGVEPWKFLVFKTDTKEFIDLSAFCWNQPVNKKATYLVLIFGLKGSEFQKNDFQYLKDNFLFRLDQKTQDIFLKLAVQWWNNDYTEDLNEWPHRQCYIALTNMLNCAASINIGSCPMEGMTYESINNYVYKNKLLSSDYSLAVGALFGKDTTKTFPRNRKPFDDVVKFI